MGDQHSGARLSPAPLFEIPARAPRQSPRLLQTSARAQRAADPFRGVSALRRSNRRQLARVLARSCPNSDPEQSASSISGSPPSPLSVSRSRSPSPAPSSPPASDSEREEEVEFVCAAYAKTMSEAHSDLQLRQMKDIFAWARAHLTRHVEGA